MLGIKTSQMVAVHVTQEAGTRGLQSRSSAEIIN